MSDWYELIGQTPVRMEGDLITRAMTFESMDRRVKESYILGARVSTIFLGLDYGFMSKRPILFETMIFWPGEHGHEQDRCSTWDQAERMHERMCREAARLPNWWAFLVRLAGETRRKAVRDWVLRWKDLCGIPLDSFEILERDFEELASWDQ